jgi:predicted methyltransferase
MKMMTILIGLVALVSGAIASDNANSSTAATLAIADPSRPDSDTTRDTDRKPAQTLVFVGIKPGDKVADYVADQGYFTRLFVSVVGSTGHVYAVEPTAFFKFEHFVKEVAELQGYAVAHPNVTVTTAAALEGLKFPEKLDLFWISRNYHDLQFTTSSQGVRRSQVAGTHHTIRLVRKGHNQGYVIASESLFAETDAYIELHRAA